MKGGGGGRNWQEKIICMYERERERERERDSERERDYKATTFCLGDSWLRQHHKNWQVYICYSTAQNKRRSWGWLWCDHLWQQGKEDGPLVAWGACVCVCVQVEEGRVEGEGWGDNENVCGGYVWEILHVCVCGGGGGRQRECVGWVCVRNPGGGGGEADKECVCGGYVWERDPAWMWVKDKVCVMGMCERSCMGGGGGGRQRVYAVGMCERSCMKGGGTKSVCGGYVWERDLAWRGVGGGGQTKSVCGGYVWERSCMEVRERGKKFVFTAHLTMMVISGATMEDGGGGGGGLQLDKERMWERERERPCITTKCSPITLLLLPVDCSMVKKTHPTDICLHQCMNRQQELKMAVMWPSVAAMKGRQASSCCLVCMQVCVCLCMCECVCVCACVRMKETEQEPLVLHIGKCAHVAAVPWKIHISSL